jgi:hypothetical protein
LSDSGQFERLERTCERLKPVRATRAHEAGQPPGVAAFRRCSRLELERTCERLKPVRATRAHEAGQPPDVAAFRRCSRLELERTCERLKPVRATRAHGAGQPPDVQLSVVAASWTPIISSSSPISRARTPRYPKHSYHNAYHAADVTHSTWVLLRTLQKVSSTLTHNPNLANLSAHSLLPSPPPPRPLLCARAQSNPAALKPANMFIGLLGAAIHDVGHRGVSNLHLVHSRDDLAITYVRAKRVQRRARPPKKSEASTKKMPVCGGSGCRAGLSGGDPPNPPRGRRGRTCSRPHMLSLDCTCSLSAAHAAHAPPPSPPPPLTAVV